MRIVVLLKQTFDTEERIALDANGRIVEEGVKFVINPYDEYAVEEAIRLRDKLGGKVVVVSAGPERAAEALRTALAMGADEAALLADERLDGADERVVSEALAAFIRGEGPFDVLLGGYFAVDSGGGQVAIRVAELLGMPHVGSVTKLEIDGGEAVAHRDAEGDEEVVAVALPAMFTAQQGLNEPRYPSLAGIMKAKKKPLRKLGLDEIGYAPAQPSTVRAGVALPPARKAGRLLSGSAEEQVRELARLLRDEAGAIP